MNICNICMTGSRGILGAPIPSWRLFGPHDDNADSPPESKPTQSGPAPPLYHWSPPSCNCLKQKNQKCVKLELISFYGWFPHWQNSDYQPLLTLVDRQNHETLISSIPGLVVWQNQKVLWGECQMWVWRLENLRRKGDIGPGVLRHRPITGSTLNPNVVHPSCQPEKISQFQSHWYHHENSSRELSAFNPYDCDLNNSCLSSFTLKS